MDDLLQEFIAETRETLEALAGEVIAWEADPTDRARLDAIFRFVHTVKGSCGFLDLPRLARLSHAAEDVLAAARDGSRTPDTALVNAVLSVVDRIGELTEAIDAGVALDDSSDDLLIAALAEDAAPAAPIAPTVQVRFNSRSVRLNVALLDRMMSGMSEMVLARNDLARRLREHDVDPRIEAALDRLSLTVADMRDAVTRTRMQKIDALFAAVPRMVRDTAAELGKAVQLTIDGADVELDREMIELMRDPLVHLIRNSIDHGIEAPADRTAAGKRPTGTMTIAARQSGNQILIDIADDGRGINTARLVAKARALNLHSDAALAALDDAGRCELVFHPGLSSRDEVTATSGRGVGMDIVRANIEQIGGRVILANRPGKGLAITIQVPLTLSILSTIIVGAGDHRFAVPRQSVEEIIKVRGDHVRIDTIGGAMVATVRGERLPLVVLGELLGIGHGPVDTLAIIATRDGDFALAIDTVIDTEELVIKPAAPAVMASGVYAGQTLPDNGLPMLLLDGSGVAAAAGLAFDRPVASDVSAADTAAPTTRALLFDDLDGQRRAIALHVIDRIDTVAADTIRLTAGRLRMAAGTAIIPLHAAAPLGPREQIAVLRLTDGVTDLAYAIADPIEIVALPPDITAVRGMAASGAPIAGVAMIDGEPIEVIDVHALFADHEAPLAARPLCLIHADRGGWMESFLKPVVEAAGYRCVTTLARGEVAVVALALGEAPVDGGDAPVLRLRTDRDARGPDDSSIYRYDRSGLHAALAARSGGAR